MEFLKEHVILPQEYTQKDFERDQQAIAAYRKEVRVVSPDPKKKF